MPFFKISTSKKIFAIFFLRSVHTIPHKSTKCAHGDYNKLFCTCPYLTLSNDIHSSLGDTMVGRIETTTERQCRLRGESAGQKPGKLGLRSVVFNLTEVFQGTEMGKCNILFFCLPNSLEILNLFKFRYCKELDRHISN